MVRPIDMQQVITHISTVEKVQHVKQEQPGMEHRHFALQVKEEDAQKRNQIKESHETKETEIRDEGKEKKGRREKKRLRCADEEESNIGTAQKPPELDHGSIVDLIV